MVQREADARFAEREQVGWPALSCSAMEGHAWLVLGGFAALLRLFALGQRPLDPAESAIALEAWRWANGQGHGFEAGPALVNLLSLLFYLFTGSDFLARVPSAVAGTALTLAPYLLRRSIGGGPAFGAGLCLALSPTLVFASRHAAPAMLLALGVMALHSVATLQQRRSHVTLILPGIILALGMGVDRSFLLVLAPWALSFIFVPPSTGASDGGDLLSLRWGRLLLAGYVTTVVVAHTALLTRLEGIQAGVVAPLLEWANQLSGEPSGWRALFLLLLYDLPIVVGACLGAAVALRIRSPEGSRLVLWFLGAMVLATLSPAQDLRFSVQPLLPLSLLAGIGLDRLVKYLAGAGLGRPLVAAAVVSVPLVHLYLTLHRHFVASQRLSESSLLAASSGLSAALLAIMLWPSRVAVAHGPGEGKMAEWRVGEWLRGSQLPAVFVLIGAMLLGFIWGSTVIRLNYPTGDPRQSLLVPESTTPGLRVVEESLVLWSRQVEEGPLLVDRSLERMLGWSLRGLAGWQYAELRGRPVGRTVLAGERAATVTGLPHQRVRVIERHRLSRLPDFRSLWGYLTVGTPLVTPEARDIILVR